MNKNDFLKTITITLVIPLVLCLITPYLLYVINVEIGDKVWRFEPVYMYLAFKFLIYTLISFLVYVFYTTKNNKTSRYQYMIGIVVGVLCVFIGWFINFFIFYSTENLFTLALFFTTYLFQILIFKNSKANINKD